MNRNLHIIAGLFVVLLSLGYLYRPRIILAMNEYMRRTLFNDQWLVTRRKKIGVLLFLAGIIILYLSMAR